MENKSHQHIAFRPDIEGIRAVAVLLILFNHSGVRGFSGGFIGVDVFFVISGYLITSILLRDIQNNTNSIAQFYRRRILRILPALFALLIFTTAMSFLFMVPHELTLYGKSLLATLFFSSNFAFYADTGYFSLAASTRPLLHTWSLAIEEQFYIFWPLLITFCARKGRTSVNSMLVAVVIISLALAIWMVATDMSAAFYLLPFRAWELALGGMLTMLPQPQRLPQWLRQIAGVAGLLVILACTNRYRELATPFPGLAATLPCLGTAALILAGPQTLTGRLLAFPITRFFGRISYSLYLWHWPVIVFTRLALWPIKQPTIIAVDLIISIALAWFSYRIFEQHGRRLLDRLPTPRLFAATLGAMALGAAGAGAIIAAKGFPQRYSAPELRIASVLDGDEQKSYRSGSCFVVEPGDRFDADSCLKLHGNKPSLLLVGDSTAAHLWPGFAQQSNRLNVLQATIAGCRPQISTQIKMECQAFFNQILLDWLAKNHPDAVALAGNWQASDIESLGRTLAMLRDRHVRAIVIGPMPRYDTSLARLLFFTPEVDRPRIAALHLDPDLGAVDRAIRTTTLDHGATYIAPIDLLCTSGPCQIYAAPGIPLQFDDVHLTHQGSALLIDRMMPTLERAIALPPSDIHAASLAPKGS
ncbi:MAG TPA: acyltransferase family protein [Sphingobium sp.]|uniref:acyltransferase family protein n=1 Tax=Sphingobium sp. TaxID=1912891 RepID=UPI002ED3F02B